MKILKISNFFFFQTKAKMKKKKTHHTFFKNSINYVLRQSSEESFKNCPRNRDIKNEKNKNIKNNSNFQNINFFEKFM